MCAMKTNYTTSTGRCCTRAWSGMLRLWESEKFVLAQRKSAAKRSTQKVSWTPSTLHTPLPPLPKNTTMSQSWLSEIPIGCSDTPFYSRPSFIGWYPTSLPIFPSSQSSSDNQLPLSNFESETKKTKRALTQHVSPNTIAESSEDYLREGVLKCADEVNKPHKFAVVLSQVCDG